MRFTCAEWYTFSHYIEKVISSLLAILVAKEKQIRLFVPLFLLESRLKTRLKPGTVATEVACLAS